MKKRVNEFPTPYTVRAAIERGGRNEIVHGSYGPWKYST